MAKVRKARYHPGVSRSAAAQAEHFRPCLSRSPADLEPSPEAASRPAMTACRHHRGGQGAGRVDGLRPDATVVAAISEGNTPPVAANAATVKALSLGVASFVMTAGGWEVEFYADEYGREPCREWAERLSPTKKAAFMAAVEVVLTPQGINVASNEFGKALGGGLYELRIRQTATEIRQRVAGLPLMILAHRPKLCCCGCSSALLAARSSC